MIRIVENRFLNNDGGCNPDISEKHYYECYRKFIESAIHSEKYATKYCENKLKDFGNCTVPQVIIYIFVVINLIISKKSCIFSRWNTSVLQKTWMLVFVPV